MGIFTGGAGNDVLTGTAAVDVLDGLGGDDTLKGGKGNDIYGVDRAGDVVVEAANEGIDTVVSTAAAYTLAVNVENLTLGGSAAIDGAGNALDNKITGNSAANHIAGGAGNDSLDGGSDIDTLSGGAGDDTLTDSFGGDRLEGGTGNDRYVVSTTGSIIVESAKSGIDTVEAIDTSFSLFSIAQVENLVLTGNGANGTGNNLHNAIIGNAFANTLLGLGGNDTLNGGTGADKLNGGAGDDTYIVDNQLDQVTEAVGGGNDTVRAFADYKLAAGQEIETLILGGSSDIEGFGNEFNNLIRGSSGDNLLFGGGGNDTLRGGDGDDSLQGGVGKDELRGGTGNDSYFLDSIKDVVIEGAGAGKDTVVSSIASFVLGANFENLTLSDFGIKGTGNALRNVIRGNLADNRLDGLAGNDTLEGGAGADTLIGGIGNDFLDGGAGFDLLQGGAGNDTLRDLFSGPNILKGGIGNDLYIVDSTETSIVEAAGAGTDEVRVLDIDYSLAKLGAVEKLSFVGALDLDGTGNKLNNVIIGNDGVNILDGGAGNDTLNGGLKADTLKGGKGNDFYIVDNVGDVVVELAGEGTDTIKSSVSFSLIGTAVEKLILSAGGASFTGTGNNLNNVITGFGNGGTLDGLGGNDTLTGKGLLLGYDLFGGSGNDTLTGGNQEDRLDGGTGADRMSGGDGNDVYIVDRLGDKTIEAANGGIDRVESNLTDYTLAANIENLKLTGGLNAIGNELANEMRGNDLDNRLLGAAGNDTLAGGEGKDTLVGGAGNDSLDGDVGDDRLNGGAGNDRLEGGAGNDALNGSIGNDILQGGAGADTLTGGDGKDVFLYRANVDLAQQGLDLITDFVRGSDKIDVRELLADFEITFEDAFADGNILLGKQGSDTLISFDIDGKAGVTAAVTLAVVSGVALTHSDFVLSDL